MKQFKKVILTILCVGVILGAVGCGNTNMDDNTTDDRNNEVTEGTDNHRDDNLIDDVGNAVEDGMDNVGEGVKDMTEDITGNNR